MNKKHITSDNFKVPKFHCSAADCKRGFAGMPESYSLTWKKKAAYIFHTVYKNSCILVAQTLLVQALKCVFADNPDF